MQWFRNLKTGTKIITLVILIAISLAGVGFTGYYYIKLSNTNTNVIYSNKLLAISYLKEARADNRNIEGMVYRLFLALQTKDQEQQLKNQMNNLVKQYDQNITHYKQLKLDPYEVGIIAKYDDELGQYRDKSDKAMRIATNDDKISGYKYFTDIAIPHLEKTNTFLQDLSDYNDKTAKELMDQSNKNFATSTKIIISISMVAILFALGIGLIVGRLISVSLNKVVANINEIAGGNLSLGEVNLNSKDEIGIIAKAVNGMAANLRDLIGQVATSAKQVASFSEELTTSAEQQAQATNQVSMAISGVAAGTEKQSNAIDETSTAIEQISRLICWLSTPRSRRPGLASKVADSQWWPRKCANLPNSLQNPPSRLPL